VIWERLRLWQVSDNLFQLRMPWRGNVPSPSSGSLLFLRDSPSFQLVPEVAPLPNEAVFDKITMLAFEGTPLDIVLRDCEINAFTI
jgi:nicotinamidase-related amidase